MEVSLEIRIVHSAAEIAGAVLQILIWRYLKKRRGWNEWAANGFFAGAVIDVIHATVSLLVPGLVAFWVPATWALSRLALGSMQLIGLFMLSSRRRPGHQTLLVATGAVGGMWLAGNLGLEWSYQDALIHRPADFVLMLVWIGLLVFVRQDLTLWRARWGAVQWFGRGFKTPLLIGVSCHATMAFLSSESMDPPFMVAHGLKLAEYAIAYQVCRIGAAR